MKRPNAFAAVDLDRVPGRRRDPAWISARLRDPGTRVVPVWRSRSLVSAGEPPVAVTLAPGDFEAYDDRIGAILLGVRSGSAYFAIDLSAVAEPLRSLGLEDASFVDLRSIGALLDQADGALLAYARSMVHWHRHHLHCGRCGSGTESTEGGHVRRCQDVGCGSSHFPRTDPAVIVLVTDERACLLGRQATWPPRLYSTLAGFVEPGESLSEAVYREVMEETGVAVTGVRYHSSQPWPFPSSLMLGFTATAERAEPRADGDELDDVRWFDREELLELHRSAAIRLPASISISRRLISEWLGGQERAGLPDSE